MALLVNVCGRVWEEVAVSDGETVGVQVGSGVAVLDFDPVTARVRVSAIKCEQAAGIQGLGASHRQTTQPTNNRHKNTDYFSFSRGSSEP